MLYAHTIWIHVGNILLGVLVLLCVLIFTVAVLRDIVEMLRKRSPAVAQLDRELLHLFGITPYRVTRHFPRKH